MVDSNILLPHIQKSSEVSPSTSIIVSGPTIQEAPKSANLIFWLTLILSLLYLFNAYKTLAVIVILNQVTSKVGMLPYSMITIMPLILVYPVVTVASSLALFYCAFKIKTGSYLGIKLIIIFSLVLYLTAFTLGSIIAYQLPKYTAANSAVQANQP